MYQAQLEEKRKLEQKKKKAQLSKLKKDLESAATMEDDDACYVLPGRDAGAGLTLRLDNEDDDTSSDEELAAPGELQTLSARFLAKYKLAI
jgi:hypothetical protein